MAFKKANYEYCIDDRQTRSILRADVSGRYGNYTVQFISTDDTNVVEIRIFGLAKSLPEKRDAILEIVNECNCKYRFLRFALTSDLRIKVGADTPNSAENVGDVAVDLFKRTMSIVDEVYPLFMKAIWS